MKRWVLIFALLWAFRLVADPPTTHAADSSGNPDTSNLDGVKVVKRGTIPDAALTKLYAKLAILQKALGPYFPKPRIRVHYAMKGFAPNYDPERGVLEVNYKDSIPGPKDAPITWKTKAACFPVWWHEYSHSIFEAALRKKFPAFKQRTDAARASYAEQRRQGMPEKKQTNTAGPFAPDKVFDLVSPYNEFFADAVPVVLSGKSHPIQDCYEGAHPAFVNRDFAKPYELKEDAPSTATFGHEILGPSANYVWDTLKWAKTKKCYTQGLFLKTLFGAIQADINARYNDKTLYGVSHSVANQNFIKRINAEFKKAPWSDPEPEPSREIASDDGLFELAQ